MAGSCDTTETKSASLNGEGSSGSCSDSAPLCNSVLLHRAEAMTNHPHRSECCGPRSGVLRVCACALPALRIQVYERREPV
ncbi:hypothetical protein QQF64_028142 [Cirrhinus molitorella]|uniref:Uncharacterized protein n=1 Tax=Cirrhinus molitorella TaxID=172907 RepID=A0ABR3N5S2_9TELE